MRPGDRRARLDADVAIPEKWVRAVRAVKQPMVILWADNGLLAAVLRDTGVDCVALDPVPRSATYGVELVAQPSDCLSRYPERCAIVHRPSTGWTSVLGGYRNGALVSIGYAPAPGDASVLRRHWRIERAIDAPSPERCAARLTVYRRRRGASMWVGDVRVDVTAKAEAALRRARALHGQHVDAALLAALAHSSRLGQAGQWVTPGRDSPLSFFCAERRPMADGRRCVVLFAVGCRRTPSERR